MFTKRYVLARTMLLLVLSAALATAQTAVEPDTREASSEDDEQAQAEPSDTSWRRPIASRNQFPVSLLFVSLVPDKAETLPVGRTAIDINFDYSNIITVQDEGSESIHLDLEYLRTDLGFKYGLPKQIEIGASIPLYIYYGGFLDPFVSGFHEAFNLPNFRRGQTDNGLTRFELATADGIPFLSDDNTSGVGDFTIHLKKTLFARNSLAAAVRTAVKLPSGDPQKLTGSGSTDVGFGFALDRITERWALYANANYHVLGQPEEFRAKNFVSLMVGADYRLKPRLTAHLQYEYARPQLESGLPIFNEGGETLALGLRWRYSDRFLYEWRFVEDFSDVSPDFTIAFQLGIRLNRKNDPDAQP